MSFSSAALHDHDVIDDLTLDECWELLRHEEFGRMAFHEGDRVSLVPLNYAVDDRKRLVFRTASGSKLLAVTENDDVSFEVDRIDDRQAVSVILRGRAREIHGPEAAWVDTLPLRPWVPTEKYHVIAIEPTEVAGRRFQLQRPWLHIVPEEPVAPREL